MNKWLVIFLLVVCSGVVSAQSKPEQYDSVAVAKIIDEGMNRSQVMDILSTMTDVYGPRLTYSPEYKVAAKWALDEYRSLKLSDPHLEGWGPLMKGWTLKRYEANVIGRQVFPLISYPKAWCSGTGGRVTADILYMDAKTDSAVKTYRGKVKGKFVLLSDPREVKAHFEPEATREADSTLLKMANSAGPRQRGRRYEMTPEERTRALVGYHKLQMCQEEGAAGILTASWGDGGNIFVQGASVPMHPDTPYTSPSRISAYDAKAPKLVPQISVGAEHYNRLVRMIQKGERPKLEMELDVKFSPPDSGYSIIAEIPGSDLKDEIVMIGGHFDSWHGGTGATDDATGSAVCIETMRLLQTLNLHPRRTIRIGLWGGEEEGLLGSRAYVTAHFGERKGSPADPIVEQKPDAEKFSVYFNNDNGSGKVRGVYLQGNEGVRPIFRSWLKPFASMGASTLTPENTGGTDHLSFDAVGLPGFQFIQDELEYSTRTHHSIMDVYERVQPEDLKQASVIMAAFAYNAAMRDERFPRKPLPQTQVTQGKN